MSFLPTASKTGKQPPVDLPIPELTGSNLRRENSADRWVIPSCHGDLERITAKTGGVERRVMKMALRELAKAPRAEETKLRQTRT